MEYLKKCFPHNNMKSCVIRLGSICSFWIQTFQSSQQEAYYQEVMRSAASDAAE